MVFCKYICSSKIFGKIHKKTFVWESHFIKAAGEGGGVQLY